LKYLAIFQEITSATQPDLMLITSQLFLKKPSSALMCFEIGGLNAFEPLLVGALLDVPVLDADGMGRAFPELQMYVPTIFGHAASPAVLTDEKGLTICIENCDDPKKLENVFRHNLVNFMGYAKILINLPLNFPRCLQTFFIRCAASVTMNPIQLQDISSLCVIGSYTRAWELGHAVIKAKLAKVDPVKAVLESMRENAKLIIQGKV
jgi:DUF917 family protein